VTSSIFAASTGEDAVLLSKAGRERGDETGNHIRNHLNQTQLNRLRAYYNKLIDTLPETCIIEPNPRSDGFLIIIWIVC